MRPWFKNRYLGSLDGNYHTLVHMHVFIHYLQNKTTWMIKHIISMAKKWLIWALSQTLTIRPSRNYLHSDKDVDKTLKVVGWVNWLWNMKATKFYFWKLPEVVLVGLGWPTSAYICILLQLHTNFHKCIVLIIILYLSCLWIYQMFFKILNFSKSPLPPFQIY